MQDQNNFAREAAIAQKMQDELLEVEAPPLDEELAPVFGEDAIDLEGKLLEIASSSDLKATNKSKFKQFGGQELPPMARETRQRILKLLKRKFADVDHQKVFETTQSQLMTSASSLMRRISQATSIPRSSPRTLSSFRKSRASRNRSSKMILGIPTQAISVTSLL
ncbi:hypothetical protein CC79DRAFT_157536 [Sarocladium strictum]